MTDYTQVRITTKYLEKLRALAKANKRSMLKQLEVLIDEAGGNAAHPEIGGENEYENSSN